MIRLKSLDIMRGLTVALMILVNNGGEQNYHILTHSKWNGLTPCDLVFPFFLFMMGMSTYLSLRKTEFKPSLIIYRKIAKRTILLFLIGLSINWFDMICSGNGLDFAHLRIWAVLQRIAQFMENEKGRIKPGFMADMVILDKDIFTCDPMEIRDILPVMTIVGGEIVYER